MELRKFPPRTIIDHGDDESPEVIDPPYSYRLLSQQPTSKECCIEILGDKQGFEDSGIDYMACADIPRDHEQGCLHGKYGKHLSISQIEEIESILETLTEEELEQVESLGMLRLMKRLKEAEKLAGGSNE